MTRSIPYPASPSPRWLALGMPAPVFVLGAPRSGTTLLRVMLAGHPALFSPPEMVIAPFATMAERRKKLDERFWEKGGLRRTLMELHGIDVEEAKQLEAEWEPLTVPEVYQRLIEALGERYLVDKCPHLSADPAALSRLARWFPDSRWVWIIRHPGSVTRSIENMPMAEVILQGYAPDARSIWYYANRNIQAFLEQIPGDRQTTVKYEDLVESPEAPLRRITDLLGLAYVPAMAHPYEGDRMRDGPPGARAVGDPNLAGRGKLDPELATKWLVGFDPASVSPETHGLARALGYDLSTLPPPPITAVSEAMGAFFRRAVEIEQALVVPDDLDALEGRRFLSRMVAQSLDLYVEEADADRPRFAHAEGPTRKMFADNPDADYLRAPIRMDFGADGTAACYRVHGALPRGTVYAGMLLYGKGGRVAARLADRHFARPDGTFVVWISRERPAGVPEGSWLRADGDETAVFVRQYFSDRVREAPIELHIERIGDLRPDTLEPAGLARRYQLARRNLDGVFARTAEARKMAQAMALNRFMPIGGEALFPTPDNSYLVMWYRLGADQRLFIRGQAPIARYWSFVLYNTWMESLEYRHHPVHINQSRIQAGGGHYEVCVGHRDPGHPNFLDTTGHLAGYVLLRCLLPEGEVPVPQVEVRYDRE